MTSNPLLDNGARVAPPYGSWGAQTPTAASVAMDSTSNTQGQRDSRASERRAFRTVFASYLKPCLLTRGVFSAAMIPTLRACWMPTSIQAHGS